MDTTLVKPMSFIERMQEAAAKRSTPNNEHRVLKERILNNYRGKMEAATSQLYVMGKHEYTPHYAVLWDSSIESDEFMQSVDVDKVMSHDQKSKSFLSVLQGALPPDHKVYISCKYVVYMFWKMDMFADRLYHYCAERIGERIIKAIEKNFKYASVWSMDRNADVIPELIGSDIDAILRHKYRTSPDDEKLTIVQRLQRLLETDAYNNGYDASTSNKLTVAPVYGMPRGKTPPYQIVVWGINLSSGK